MQYNDNAAQQTEPASDDAYPAKLFLEKYSGEYGANEDRQRAERSDQHLLIPDECISLMHWRLYGLAVY